MDQEHSQGLGSFRYVIFAAIISCPLKTSCLGKFCVVVVVMGLKGSMDGKTWTDLRVHEDDQTMCKAGQFASWPITAANALLPFRFFRLVLTGPTTDTSTPWNFCICYLELYGYFRWTALQWMAFWQSLLHVFFPCFLFNLLVLVLKVTFESESVSQQMLKLIPITRLFRFSSGCDFRVMRSTLFVMTGLRIFH